MAWWVVYERCDDCREESCLQCRRADRRLTLRVVEAEETPKCSLNGPCESPEIILRRIGQYFEFNQDTGIMHFRVDPRDDQ